MSTITLPSEVEFILGPQVPSGSSTAKGAQWFDRNAIERGLQLAQQIPSVNETPGNVLATGTVTLTKDSEVVEGSGTRFLSEVPNNSYFLIASNGLFRKAIYIQPPTSDTSIRMNAVWPYSSQVNIPYAIGFAETWNFYQESLNYYDFAHCLYINYYRTGDERFLHLARQMADSWWSSFPIDSGKSKAYEFGEGYAPRGVSLNGLILRALDGRPEMWEWITSYTRHQFDLWITQRLTYPALYFGAREGGYTLLYAANLAAVHPDPITRIEFRDKASVAAVNLYARLQFPDGSWRWGDDEWIGQAMQPFHVGILLEGMIAVHRLTGDPVVASAITKGAQALYMLGYNPNGWRGSYYQVGGSWSDGTNCTSGCGAASNPFPPLDIGQIAEARQLNATSIHALGYAYLLTKDEKFRQWGDEMFDATFSGDDGHRGLAWFRTKEYDESYRAGGKYLAWREGGTTVPSPSPSPTPVPTPTPTPTPTPIPTPLPCAISAPAAITIPRNMSGEINVTVSNLTQPVTVRVVGTDGQVTISPLSKVASPTSAVLAFKVRVKKQSRVITFESPCGSVQVRVNVG